MKKLLYWISFLILFILAILSGGSYYMLNYSLKPQNHGQDEYLSYQYIYQQYPYLESWIDSLHQESAFKDTFIHAHDGVVLHAYYVAAARPTSKTAILIHGYSGNGIQMFPLGHLYNKVLEYNILLPELRYSGKSGGDHICMGWQDRLDILQWMEVANNIYGDSTQIVVHGISMGGATTMMVSGELLPQYAICFIEDCGYTDVWDEFSYQLKQQFHLPGFPLMYTADWLCKLKYGWSFREASSLKQVAKCDRPMLFIHGDKDDFVPTWMVYKLYEAKSSPKELWIVPGATHGVSFRENQELYTERVRIFTEKYIK